MVRTLFLAVFTFVFLLSAAPVFASFSDMSPEHPYYYDILRLKHAGFSNGDEQGHFNPDQGINRCEMAKLTVKVYEMFSPESFNIDTTIPLNVFPDIPQGHWCNQFSAYLKHFQVIQGNEQGNFEPWREVHIAEAFKMLLNAVQVDVTGIAGEFGYIEADWEKPYMAYVGLNELESLEFIQSMSANDIAFRKVVARVITRLMDTVEDGNTLYQRQRWEVNALGLNYLNFSFSYPMDYEGEISEKGLGLFDDDSLNGNFYGFVYLPEDQFEAAFKDCEIQESTHFSRHTFTKFTCIGTDPDYGYFLKIGNGHFYALHSQGDSNLEEFEDIVNSIDWVLGE